MWNDTTRYFKQCPIVSRFPDDFHRVESCDLQLIDGPHYEKKNLSNGTEVVCSSFALLSVLLRQKTSSEVSEASSKLRNFLNKLDLSVIAGEQDREVATEGRPRASRRLKMPITPPTKHSQITSPVVMTPPKSGEKAEEKSFSSPNLKEISEKDDLDTPEKALLMKRRGSRVIKDVRDVWHKHRESLTMVLSNMSAFGDPEAKAIVNKIVEEVAEKRGVKRTVEELVGDDTLSRYVETLRVPDWKLVLFQTMARVSGKTWQSVINITGLGRTGVRNLNFSFQHVCVG